MTTVTVAFCEAREHYAAGESAAAEQSCRQVLDIQPRHADAWHLLGLIAHENGQHDRAIELVQRAIDLHGANPMHFNTLGLAHAAVANHARAVEPFRLATLLAPTFAEAHSNLGASLRDLGEHDEAESSLRRAIEINPDLVSAHYNLGLVLHAQGRRAEAIVALQQAVEGDPTFGSGRAVLVNAWHELAGVLNESGHSKQAEACLRRALEIDPDHAPASGSLGQLLAEQGHLEEARENLSVAIQREPSARLRLQQAVLLPPIYQSVEQLGTERERLIEGLKELEREGLRVDPATGPLPTLFYLAYQGQNDRVVHEAFARLIETPEPVIQRRPARRGKRRVGFASVHFRDHTIGKLMQGAIARLSREEFTVVVLSDKPHDDPVGRFIVESADEFVAFSRDVGKARARIAECDLDVLVYTDLGMDGMTLALACSRLAPVQCVTWGHPATTGLATIDYFLSSDLLETDEADAHYSEQLVRLPTLPIYYLRPTLSSPPKSRADLGLPEDAHLYACPQTLFKLHPDFDSILGDILRRDPLGRLVLLHGRHPHWDEMLLGRFRRTIPDVLDRVVFLPALSRDDFLHLSAAVDVLLDPVHFGGGNTSYEAFALGTPVVTWPSPYLKGRITQALYRKMGLDECIASNGEEYVEIVLRLGTDKAHRESIRAEILNRSDLIFEDDEAPRVLGNFLRGAGKG